MRFLLTTAILALAAATAPVLAAKKTDSAAAATAKGKRVLVLLDNWSIKETHSLFFKGRLYFSTPDSEPMLQQCHETSLSFSGDVERIFASPKKCCVIFHTLWCLIKVT